jgi:hypothetical protein
MATQLQVFGLIHYAHAPATNLAKDPVMGHRLPYGLGWRGHWLNMLGVGDGKVNVQQHERSVRETSLLLSSPPRPICLNPPPYLE